MEKKLKYKAMVTIMPSTLPQIYRKHIYLKHKNYTNSNMNANCKPANCNFPKDTFFKMF